MGGDPTRPEIDFGPFLAEGGMWGLCEEPEVRARDLADATVTVRHRDTGAIQVIAAASLLGPPIPGLEEIPDEDRYELRLLVEEILSLAMDTRQAESVLGLVTRRRMLRGPRRK